MSVPSHPGPPPARPELPEGAPVPDGPPPPTVPPTKVAAGRSGWPPFVWWTPVVALVAAFLLAAFAFAILLGIVDATTAGGVDTGDPPPGVTLGATLLQNLALIGFAVLFAGLGGRRPSRTDFGLRRMPFWKGVGWAAACFGGFYLFSFVWAVALGIDEQDDLAQQLGADRSTLNLIAVAVLVAIAAPIGEEFFFRGFFFGALGRRMGVFPAAAIVGIVFGLIHAGGTAAEFLVPLAFFGFLLCLLYHRTGSLLPCIGLHAVNNAIALGVTLDWEPWQVLVGVVAAPAITLAIAVPLSARSPRPAYG